MTKKSANSPKNLQMRAPSYVPWEGQHMWLPSELDQLPSKHPEMAGAFVEGDAEYFGKCIYYGIDNEYLEQRSFVFVATGYAEAAKITEQKSRAIAMLRPDLLKRVHRLHMETKLNNPLRSLLTMMCSHPWDENKEEIQQAHIYKKYTKNILKNANLL
jgi:hypothetical protein